jgi:hypothetical protein
MRERCFRMARQIEYLEHWKDDLIRERDLHLSNFSKTFVTSTPITRCPVCGQKLKP